MKNIGMISLGCDKNRVDGENILFSFKKAGYNIVNDEKEADIIIINTCGFIDAAKKESIDTILEFCPLKEEGKKLVVTGCLAERYIDDLKESLPEVDVFVGINSYHNIVEIVEGEQKAVKPTVYTDYQKGRVLTTPYHYAYLKIADGCDNFCSYCAIPYIRGSYRSTPMETLLNEADNLLSDGVKELILVAQDITRYGIDIYGKYMLKELLKKLILKDFVKIRLLYAYPELIDDELINMISNEEIIAKYIDIPLQHIDNNILKRMNRRSDTNQIYGLIKKIKSTNPDIAIRSSFIVGFPAESEEEFNNLKDFISKGLIDYAGFFAYSKEEGTDAALFDGQIKQSVKAKRVNTLSKLQSQNIIKNHQKYLGKAVRVIYEGIDYDKKQFFGRIEQNAPEIDTKVYFTSDFPLEIGEYYDVIINEADFNLKGRTTNQ